MQIVWLQQQGTEATVTTKEAICSASCRSVFWFLMRFGALSFGRPRRIRKPSSICSRVSWRHFSVATAPRLKIKFNGSFISACCNASWHLLTGTDHWAGGWLLNAWKTGIISSNPMLFLPELCRPAAQDEACDPFALLKKQAGALFLLDCLGLAP